MTTRRKFFGLMAAAPIAGRAAAQELASQQIGINLANNIGQQAGLGRVNASTGLVSYGPPQLQIKDALNNPLTRHLYESMVFEQERRVHAVDPDIAVHRSTSLAAKIVYQRQRNVARHFEGIQGEPVWSRMESFFRKTLGFET